MNEAQAKQFITFVVDESVLTKMARQKMMSQPIEEINRLHIGDRVLVGKAEGVAPGGGSYVTASGSQIVLSTTAFIVPWEVTFEQMEDNIEEENFEETLMREISAAVANDIEELAVNGNTGSGDPFLALVNGWFTLAAADAAAPWNSTTTAALTDKTLNKGVFSLLLKQLPTKYRRNRANLVFIVNPDDEQDYRISLSGRDTTVGDNALVLNQNLKIFGIDIVPVPSVAQGTAYVTLKKNLIYGIWKQIRLEKDKDIFKGTYQFAFHLRIGFAVEKGEAVARITGIVENTA